MRRTIRPGCWARPTSAESHGSQSACQFRVCATDSWRERQIWAIRDASLGWRADPLRMVWQSSSMAVSCWPRLSWRSAPMLSRSFSLITRICFSLSISAVRVASTLSRVLVLFLQLSGEVLELVFVELARRDVGSNGDVLFGRARIVENRKDGGIDPVKGAVPGAVADFAVPGLSALNGRPQIRGRIPWNGDAN